jgi:hypothetical protein
LKVRNLDADHIKNDPDMQTESPFLPIGQYPTFKMLKQVEVKKMVHSLPVDLLEQGAVVRVDEAEVVILGRHMHEEGKMLEPLLELAREGAGQLGREQDVAQGAGHEGGHPQLLGRQIGPPRQLLVYIVRRPVGRC